MLGNGLCVGIHIKPRMRLLPMNAFLVILLTPRDADAAYRMVFPQPHSQIREIKNFILIPLLNSRVINTQAWGHGVHGGVHSLMSQFLYFRHLIGGR